MPQPCLIVLNLLPYSVLLEGGGLITSVQYFRDMELAHLLRWISFVTQAEPNAGFCANGGAQPALVLRWVGVRLQAEVNSRTLTDGGAHHVRIGATCSLRSVESS